MNILLILLVSLAVLIAGYLLYGRWLAKEWGVDPSRKTPSHTLEDGMDYVPAKAPVLMGHHFSSIAGAGPINGPIQAAIFGWVPVLLWVVVGGIFFGGVHDFGALFASVRNKGQSIGEVIRDTMGQKAKRLFLTFAWLTLLLVVAAFASIVASKNVPVGIASVIGCVGIVLIVVIGLNWHPIALTYNTWMYVLGVYILIASVTPVWILLQPRDYLSSFLLYFMIAVAVISVVGAALTGTGSTEIPAFTGFTATGNGLFTSGTVFPALFVTIACGAISGFHSLVSSGTTAKQLDNERDAMPIGYGAMLVECVVAVLSLCAVAYVWKEVNVPAEELKLASPTIVFATGLSRMLGSFTNEGVQNVIYQMLVLAVSVFCLTSLDTATRLARYMFQEFWLNEGETPKDATGIRGTLANPYVSTAITVVFGVALGLTGYSKIWPLFGAANQLLAALGLLAVCAWLGSIGNKMFYIPMCFMLVVTICSLIQTILAKVRAGGMWSYIQAGIAVVLVVLAIDLAITAMNTLKKQHAKA